MIHYTTDGTSVSCANGATYTGTLTIAANTTLNAIACRAGFESSIAWSVVYGTTTPPAIFVTGPDRAQLAGDPSQVNMPTGTVLGQNVRLLIPDERDVAGATVDTRCGTRRTTDVDCFTTDGSKPVCSIDSPSCMQGTRYVPLTNITTASVDVTTDGNQPIVLPIRHAAGDSQVERVMRVVRCRWDIGGAVVISAVASYSYRLKVGPLSASYVTRDSSFAVVALSSKEDDATTVAVGSGAGMRTEFVGGSGGSEDSGLDSIATGYHSKQPGAISSSVAGSAPVKEDEEKICYTLDGSQPACHHITVEGGIGIAFESLLCPPGSIDNDVAPLGSSTFAAANVSVSGGLPATAGAPQRMLPFTLRAVGCKPRFENSVERQIVFGN